MQLKARKARTKYKNDTSYIEAVYRKNKEFIDSNIEPAWINKYGTPERAFKKLVKEQMSYKDYKTGKNKTVSAAIKTVANSKDLNKNWTNADIKYNNFQALLKKDKNLYSEFKKRNRDARGRFKKYNPKDLKFLGYYADSSGTAAAYKFDDLIILEFKSPQKGTGASVAYMDEWNFKQAIGKTLFAAGRTQKEASQYSYTYEEDY